MLNRVELIGNLTKDIEVRQTNTQQKAVCTLDIALNSFVNGEKKTQYVKVTAWGKDAEDAGKYLAKGRQIHVEARIVMRRENIAGKNYDIPEFHANRILYLGSSQGNGNGGGQHIQQGFQQPQSSQRFQQPPQGFKQGHEQGNNDPFVSQNGGVMGQPYNYKGDPNYPFGR